VSKAGFWSRDWFLGLAVAVGLFLAAGSDVIQSLERKAYDMGVRATSRALSDRIAVIAIDGASLRNIGRWPWSRDVHARITDASKTKTGMVLGTPYYMSPEQLAGKRIDGRSDRFSLAVSLYRLLCGRLPFEGDSMAQLMFKIANELAPDILQANPAVPLGVAAFLARAMAKDAGERFQTGEEFVRAAAEHRRSRGAEARR
jgi:serine/threonine protein kinase